MTLLILGGCNDEVFVEPLPPASTVEIPAGGGRATVSLGSVSPLGMSLDLDSIEGLMSYIINADGDTTANVWGMGATDIPGTVDFVSPKISGRVEAISAGYLDIDIRYAYLSMLHMMTIDVVYPHGVMTIPVILEPTEPFRATAIAYPNGFTVSPAPSMDLKETMRVANEGEDTVAVILHPFAGLMADVTFTPYDDTPDYPFSPSDPLPLPSPASGTAGLHGFEGYYDPNRELSFRASTLNTNLGVRVKVPPATTRRLHIFIEKAVIRGEYEVTASSPSIAGDITRRGEIRVEYPVDYVIGYNDD